MRASAVRCACTAYAFRLRCWHWEREREMCWRRCKVDISRDEQECLQCIAQTHRQSRNETKIIEKKPVRNKILARGECAAQERRARCSLSYLILDFFIFCSFFSFPSPFHIRHIGSRSHLRYSFLVCTRFAFVRLSLLFPPSRSRFFPFTVCSIFSYCILYSFFSFLPFFTRRTYIYAYTA